MINFTRELEKEEDGEETAREIIEPYFE